MKQRLFTNTKKALFKNGLNDLKNHRQPISKRKRVFAQIVFATIILRSFFQLSGSSEACNSRKCQPCWIRWTVSRLCNFRVRLQKRYSLERPTFIQLGCCWPPFQIVRQFFIKLWRLLNQSNIPYKFDCWANLGSCTSSTKDLHA